MHLERVLQGFRLGNRWGLRISRRRPTAATAAAACGEAELRLSPSTIRRSAPIRHSVPFDEFDICPSSTFKVPQFDILPKSGKLPMKLW